MDLPEIAANLQEGRDYPAVLATLVSVQGSSYRRAGARLLLSARGQHWGAISGGCLEEDLLSRGRTLLESGQPHELVSYDTTSENDLVWGVGTGCHGVVQILLERLPGPPAWLPAVLEVRSRRRRVRLRTVWQHDDADSASPATLGTSLAPDPPEAAAAHGRTLIQDLLPPWHLVVLGAGDDALPLVELAHAMDWRVTVADPRPSQATTERFPQADTVICRPCPEAITAIDWDDRTVAVVMTHHYVHDLPLLRGLLPLHLPFLGLLGPRERGRRLLHDAGFAADDPRLAALHSPVGLDLGGDGPHAVALAIMAEIQAALHGRDARPLRDRNAPIHHDP